MNRDLKEEWADKLQPLEVAAKAMTRQVDVKLLQKNCFESKKD